MTSSLVGSEMCIRDSLWVVSMRGTAGAEARGEGAEDREVVVGGVGPVSYTHLTLPTICSV
eukprot:8098219-Prorocentrum_lima.AAC.1